MGLIGFREPAAVFGDAAIDADVEAVGQVAEAFFTAAQGFLVAGPDDALAHLPGDRFQRHPGGRRNLLQIVGRDVQAGDDAVAVGDGNGGEGPDAVRFAARGPVLDRPGLIIRIKRLARDHGPDIRRIRGIAAGLGDERWGKPRMDGQEPIARAFLGHIDAAAVHPGDADGRLQAQPEDVGEPFDAAEVQGHIALDAQKIFRFLQLGDLVLQLLDLGDEAGFRRPVGLLSLRLFPHDLSS